MADTTWTNKGDEVLSPPQNNRLKFIVGGVILLAAIVFLVINAMQGNTQLYKTVDEFHAEQARLVGRDLRVAGMVIGDSIQYTQIDATSSRLEFDIVDDANNPGRASMSLPTMNRCPICYKIMPRRWLKGIMQTAPFKSTKAA